jgi:hypothetical protein
MHLILVLPMAFMLFPATKKSPGTRPSIPDFVLSFLTIGIVGIFLKMEEVALTLPKLLRAFEMGAKNSIMVATACCVADIFTTCISHSGLGLAFTSIVTAASGGILIVALILIAFACLITEDVCFSPYRRGGFGYRCREIFQEKPFICDLRITGTGRMCLILRSSSGVGSPLDNFAHHGAAGVGNKVMEIVGRAKGSELIFQENPFWRRKRKIDSIPTEGFATVSKRQVARTGVR